MVQIDTFNNFQNVEKKKIGQVNFLFQKVFKIDKIVKLGRLIRVESININNSVLTQTL
jgi:hypothetical protein